MAWKFFSFNFKHKSIIQEYICIKFTWRFKMKDIEIYKDISKRTNGDIYIGVVGPVRTGKSTFIKNFI